MKKETGKKELQQNYLVVLKKFLGINRTLIPGFLFAVILLIISMLMKSGISLITGKLLDCVSEKKMDLFVSFAVGLCGLQAVKLCVGYMVNAKVNHLSEDCINRMRLYTYQKISGASMSWLDNHKLGDIISRVNGDLNELVKAVNKFLTWEVSNMVYFLVSLVICFLIQWKLSLISFALMPGIAFLQFQSGRPIADLGQKRAEAEGRVSAAFMDFMGGRSISKAFGMEREMEKKYEEEVAQRVKANVRSFAMEFILYPLQILLNFLPMLCIMAFGTYFVMKDQMTLGGLLAYVMVSDGVLSGVGELSWQVRDIYNTVGIANRIFDIWEVEQEAEGGNLTKRMSDIPVVFRNVHFGYKEGLEILHGIDFEVKPGEQVAIVGASGSGKSTVMKLLAGFYQQSQGSIRIYGNERMEWNTQALREQIAYVGQDAFLFPGTICSNVLLGRKGATEEEAREVLKMVGLEHLDGNAQIGERGGRLSGGQRQRVCIARALLKDAPLILMDEPTSALDTESEYQVQDALLHLSKGKTTIRIAHRLSAIHQVDRIICIQEGQVAEQGTHEELMRKQGIYYALYQNQTKEENGDA